MRSDKTKLLTIGVLIGCFLLGVLSCLLCAAGGEDLMDELVSAIKTQEHEKARQLSAKLVEMGDEAMPLIEKGAFLLKEGGLHLENVALAGYMMHVLKNIKTKQSTQILLDLIGQWKDSLQGEYYIVGSAMSELSNRDIDLEIDKPLLEFMLKRLRDGNVFTASQAARILGKMKKVDPKVRAEAIIECLREEVSRQNDPNIPHQQSWIGSYLTKAQYKIRQYIFALEDIGAAAIPFISDALSDTGSGGRREYLTICLCLAGGKKKPSVEVKSEITHLAKNSPNGEIRTLAMRILGEWEDKALIPLFKDALNDNYKVAVKTDVVIRPDTYKGRDGYYYYDYYPVRDEAFSGLRKLGVKIKREGNKFTVEE